MSSNSLKLVAGGVSLVALALLAVLAVGFLVRILMPGTGTATRSFTRQYGGTIGRS
jgi:hypothetical protein